MPQAPWVAPERLGQIVLASLFEHFGWAGLLVATGPSFAAAVACCCACCCSAGRRCTQPLARQLGSHVENGLGLWLDRFMTELAKPKSVGGLAITGIALAALSTLPLRISMRISWMPSPPERRSASPSHITSRGRFQCL
jgi:hypothetical protein